MRCWPNGDECKALGAAKAKAYAQAEQRRRRAVWPQPAGTGALWGHSVVAGCWQWAGTAARPAPRTASQSAPVAYATVSPTGSYRILAFALARSCRSAAVTIAALLSPQHLLHLRRCCRRSTTDLCTHNQSIEVNANVIVVKMRQFAYPQGKNCQPLAALARYRICKLLIDMIGQYLAQGLLRHH
jgi:hypothetical protein